MLAATAAMLVSSGAAFAAQTPIQFNLINVGGVDQDTASTTRPKFTTPTASTTPATSR